MISVASGTKCVSGEKISLQGQSVNDCHAEVLARRGFVSFLYHELRRLFDGQESVLLRVGPVFVTGLLSVMRMANSLIHSCVIHRLQHPVVTSFILTWMCIWWFPLHPAATEESSPLMTVRHLGWVRIFFVTVTWVLLVETCYRQDPNKNWGGTKFSSPPYSFHGSSKFLTSSGSWYLKWIQLAPPWQFLNFHLEPP